MSVYTAIATRSDGWWAVEVPAVDGLLTQTRRLDQIPDMVRDALAFFPEIEDEPAAAEIVVKVDGAEQSLAAHARGLNDQAKAAQKAASAAMTAAAADLAGRGLPYRDIGHLLGVSFQRAQKLATNS